MTNSLISNVMLSQSAPTPEVGMGATIAMWTDRHAATIVEVVRFKSGPHKGEIKGVIVQRDNAKRVDKLGMSDAQTYEYTRNPEATKVLFTMRYKKHGDSMVKVGYASRAGDKLIVGHRDEHYDFSF